MSSLCEPLVCEVDGYQRAADGISDFTHRQKEIISR